MRQRMRQTLLKVKKENLEKMESPTLTEFLKVHYAGMSRTSMKQMMQNSQVCINGKVVTRHDYELKIGDCVQINSGKISYELKSSLVKLLWEDEDIIVVVKREGVLSVSATADKRDVSAFSITESYLKRKDSMARLYAVHRLDKATSGVMMFAKTVEMQHYLRDNWKRVVTERTYIAITEGVPKKDEGTIESYLHESRAQMMFSGSESGGKLSITHYRIVRKTDGYAMLKLNLQTGRKNQIRVHLSDIGCPIIGDHKYGAKEKGCGRLALHAKVLEFRHPRTGETMRFETPVPPVFNEFMINEEKKEQH